jgi:2-amino-4-hydroxy-6-hydroxymethyldihydropteridine diphosphokinase
MKAYLGLGGNVGDARANIRAAIGQLGELGAVEAVSSFYETEPVGFADQPWFVNCALILETALPAEELLAAAKKIERELGRTPAAPNGPRTIDIDILLYGDRVMETGALTIPHPRMHERRFVLVPLSEIAPEALHPIFKKNIAGLLDGLSDASGCRKVATLAA